ncbi:MFS transporter [Pueribacillus theae]|uniref:MFS transporter n=1 Tax=Pueribacillus theae TaxID=2171751 RepID=A0A2U1K829_9BACI|nr:YbfB/YjiJ family MFS transporter [Pueribacillus theae]PWA13098.1 MFS transporter [Pueribacillus theae]
MRQKLSPIYVTFIGFSVLAIVMGIGRFAYTPILPYMEQQHLSSYQAGLLATVNYAGYFIGAFLAGKLTQKPATLLWMIGINIITTLIMGLTDSIAVWFVSRLISGLTSGIAFVLVSSLILQYIKQALRGSLAGWLYGGVGFGIFLSGILTVPLSSFFGGWEASWVGLAIVSFVLYLFIFFGLSTIKTTTTLEAYGEKNEPYEDAKTKQKAFFLYSSYFFEGFGYIIFATFIISMLATTIKMNVPSPYIWAIVGIGAIPSCIFWMWLSVRITTLSALKLAYLVQIIGVILPIFLKHSFFISLSAIFFGGTFLGITMLTFSIANDLFPTSSQQKISGLTTVYGIGQMLGPIIASLLISDRNYVYAFSLAAVFLIIGFISLKFVNKEKETVQPLIKLHR